MTEQNRKKIEVSSKHNELCKILKYENLVQSGGEAKFAIAEGEVKVNGEVETRKRKKIFSGDVIEFDGQVLDVVLSED